MDLLTELKKLRRAIAIEVRAFEDDECGLINADVSRLRKLQLELAQLALTSISELIDQLRTKQLDHGAIEILTRVVDVLELAQRPIRAAKARPQTGQIPIQAPPET